MQFADVAGLADALDSGASARKGVEVQVLSSALLFTGFLAIAGSPVFLWDPSGTPNRQKTCILGAVKKTPRTVTPMTARG